FGCVLPGAMLLIAMGLISGCGSGSDAPAPIVTPEPALLSGVFVDSPVSGLSYTTVTQSGLTDADGTFQYRAGETVTFSAGEIVLGSTGGKAVITPVDLANGADSSANMKAVNIARFLQLIDVDGNAANGIEITDDIRAGLTWQEADGDNDGSIFDDQASIFVATGVFAVFMDQVLASLNSASVFTALSPRGLATRSATGARRNFDTALTAIAPHPFSPYVKEVGIGVTNLNISMAFYEHVLGMQFVGYQGRADRVEAVYEDNRASGRNRVVLMQFNDPAIDCTNRPVKLILAGPAVADMYAAIIAGGGAGFIEPAYPLGSPNLVAMALDPDGYMIELLEYALPGYYLTGIGIGVESLEPMDDFHTGVAGMRLKYYLNVPLFMNEVIMQSRLSPNYDVSAGMDVVLMDYFNDTGKDYQDVPAKIAYTVANPTALVQAIAAKGLPVIQVPSEGVRGVAKDPSGYEVELIAAP
ncbi:MAG: VOC family protein, partial [Smithellaceae bacterium]